MKWIDDILYVLGWVCAVVVTMSIDWRLGVMILSAACFLTAFIIARYRKGGKL